MRFRLTALRWMTFIVPLSLATSACSESAGPVAPPLPRPPLAAPSVTQVTPAVGSAGGGTTIKIVGTGFMAGMVVTFDGAKVSGGLASQPNSSVLFHGEAPEHAAGTVDLVVTNPDGQSHRLEAGYTYAPRDSFDMNGVWTGFTDNGTDTGVEFEIKNDRLISATCAYIAYMPFTFSETPSIQNGEFLLTADDGATLSGRVVSDSEIVGTINFPLCNPAPLTWRVQRKVK
jgi:IPT/TIG domain-containing protein